jgi:tRNA threonylcarbamoyladenosine biosynthesis protein TsaB
VLILALDTATPSGSIAILRDEKVIGVVSTATDETYSSRMFRQLDFLLGELRLSPGDFDLFAVNSGPGSFTGLRVGLTAAKGWAEAYHKPVAAISGLEAVATQCRAEPLIVPVLDARRGQVYYGLYCRLHGRVKRQGEERVGTPEEFASALAQLSAESSAVVACPDAELVAKLGMAELSGAGQGASIRMERVSGVLAPVIGWIAHERASRGDLADALSVDANYVRRSDAELDWKGTR